MFHSRTRWALALLLVAAAFATQAPAQDNDALSPDSYRTENVEPVTLRFNLKQGQAYKIYFESDQTITQSAMGQQQKIDQVMGMGMRMTKTGTTDAGDHVVQVKYERVKIDMAAMGMKIQYDSDKDEQGPTNPMARTFAALVGTEFTAVLNDRGQVVEVRDIDKMIDKVVGALDLPNPQAKAQARQAMKQQFGEDNAASTLNQLAWTFPENALTIGESWTNTQKMAGPVPVAVESNSTLRGVTDERALLEISSTVDVNQKDPNTGQQFDLEGKQQGMIAVDRSTGLPARGKMTQSFEGKVTIDAGGRSMTVPMTIESTSTIEGNPVND